MFEGFWDDKMRKNHGSKIMINKKTALVTGATSGIGLETAKGLLEQGFFVIGTSRSEEKEKLARQYLGKGILFIRADLSSQASIRELAVKVKSVLGGSGLDALINNAGSFFSYYSLSDEGVEKQFAVNAIAPLYLSLMLYGELRMAEGRIINVSSSSHYRTRIRWHDIQLSRNYSQLKAYKQSKLISVMLSKHFNELSKSVKMYMADPGLVNTDIGYKNTGGIAKFIWKLRKNKGQPPSQGAQTSIYLAGAEELPDELYFKDSMAKEPDKMANNHEYVIRIWDYCQKVMGINAKEIIDPHDRKQEGKDQT